MTHPLTEENYYKEIINDRSEKVPSEYTEFTRTDMRDIADWQLEQAIKWLKTTQWYLNPSTMADLLEEAMRPQQQEDN